MLGIPTLPLVGICSCSPMCSLLICNIYLPAPNELPMGHQSCLIVGLRQCVGWLVLGVYLAHLNLGLHSRSSGRRVLQEMKVSGVDVPSPGTHLGHLTECNCARVVFPQLAME